MSVLEFISSIVRSSVWPLTLLMILLMLKAPITQLVQSIRSISYRDVRIDVGEQLQLIEQSTQANTMQTVLIQSEEDDEVESPRPTPLPVEQIAHVSPRAAVLYVWSIVEKETEDLLQVISKSIHTDESQKLDSLKKHHVLDAPLLKMFVDLKKLYEHVAAEAYIQVTPSEALRYCELCERIRYQLTLNEKKHRD
ncbi:hypothetical protein [Alkalicoccobacillus gibsonii]|uniref:hypothetical protein n=1 Tax=Alkalicoccobacillus gibsonii TaxID=79881 RepID=UPI0019345672|nr:hypothetical protein [Alkalicoccobacillus gibsonii]MBM0066326.1 hypothetical protein [Alkalicoccobacillus gibsonii]